MLRFDIITLFPELFAPFMQTGVTRRAFAPGGPLAVELWPLREHALDTYRRVDDRPYGGGPGMVMLAEPLERALVAAQAARGAPAPVIHFSPTGEPLTQALLHEMAAGEGAVLLCGRYEGIDQRLLDRHVTREVSLGDFVLSGGELPALALLDGVARLLPGVLADARSHEQDSFEAGLLDCPHYSRPETWVVDGAEWPVPPVLLSGHHADIDRWRREQALARTARLRPDLIASARAAGRLTRLDEALLAQIAAGQTPDQTPR